MDIMALFPTEISYKVFIENIKWRSYVNCPFCNSRAHSKIRNTFRFHCNSCNSDFSITVNTIMHGTRVDMRKWVEALDMYLSRDKISYRELASLIKVNKNTAYRILNQIQILFNTYKLEVVRILGFNSPYYELLTKVLLIDIKSRRSIL